ncbi:MAG TPA: hypothetical protein VFQ60_04230 [Patescibacteria group bacterium]|nr:hypothetical protein [Patescibacteria group bacterium]
MNAEKERQDFEQRQYAKVEEILRDCRRGRCERSGQILEIAESRLHRSLGDLAHEFGFTMEELESFHVQRERENALRLFRQYRSPGIGIKGRQRFAVMLANLVETSKRISWKDLSLSEDDGKRLLRAVKEGRKSDLRQLLYQLRELDRSMRRQSSDEVRAAFNEKQAWFKRLLNISGVEPDELKMSSEELNWITD